jgi:hypothetical protein
MDATATGANFETTSAFLARAVHVFDEKKRDSPAFEEAAGALGAVCVEFQSMYTRYALVTANANLKMANPHTFAAGEKEIQTAVSGQDFGSGIKLLLGKLENVFKRCSDRLGPGRPPGERRKKGGGAHELAALLDMIVSLNNHAALGEHQTAPEDVCEKCAECGLALVVHNNLSESRCPGCQRIVPLYCAAYDAITTLEGRRSKSGCFSPSRHHETWLERIQALESESEIGDPNNPDNKGGELVIAALRLRAQQTNKYLSLLRVDDVRNMLRVINRTDLNKNAALLLKHLTGRSPPVLTEDQKVRGGMMFSQVIQTRAALPSSGTNRNYYPYYILKIYDLILEPDDPARLLLCYIHLQGAETLNNNDTEWRHICGSLEWEWRATSPAKIAGWWERFCHV